MTSVNTIRHFARYPDASSRRATDNGIYHRPKILQNLTKESENKKQF